MSISRYGKVKCVDCKWSGDENELVEVLGDWVPYGDTNVRLPSDWGCPMCKSPVEDFYENEDDDDGDECIEQDSKLFCGENRD
jgi:rubredoxin